MGQVEYKFPPEGREVSVRGKEVYVRGDVFTLACSG